MLVKSLKKLLPKPGGSGKFFENESVDHRIAN